MDVRSRRRSRSSSQPGQGGGKRKKHDSNQPTRVVYVGNLAPEFNEHDLWGLGKKFGHIVRTLIMRKQAFIQFSSEIEAIAMKQHYATNPQYFGGRRLYVEYSDRKEIIPSQSGSNASFRSRSPPISRGREIYRRSEANTFYETPIDISPYTVPSLVTGGVLPQVVQQTAIDPVSAHPIASSAVQPLPAPVNVVSNSQQKSKVLHVRNIDSSVTDQMLADVVHSLTVGDVVKTLLFPNKNQGFVELDSEDSAAEVIASCETMQPRLLDKILYFAYSRRLNISPDLGRQGSANADTTTTTAPISTATHSASLGTPVATTTVGHMPMMTPAVPSMVYQAQPAQQLAFTRAAPVLLPPAVIRQPFSPPMRRRSSVSPPRGRSYDRRDHDERRYRRDDGMEMRDSRRRLDSYRLDDRDSRRDDRGESECRIVYCSNIVEGKMTPERIRALFSDYGDVLKVKIIYNRPTEALVELGDNSQAHRVVRYLDGFPIFGQPLRINVSRHMHINVSSPSDPNDPKFVDHQRFNQDFSSSMKRFNDPRRDFTDITAPSRMLHISNMLRGTTCEQMVELFDPSSIEASLIATHGQCGWVQMRDLDDALEAVMDLDFKEVRGRPIHVSFSNKRELRATSKSKMI